MVMKPRNIPSKTLISYFSNFDESQELVQLHEEDCCSQKVSGSSLFLFDNDGFIYKNIFDCNCNEVDFYELLSSAFSRMSLCTHSNILSREKYSFNDSQTNLNNYPQESCRFNILNSSDNVDQNQTNHKIDRKLTFRDKNTLNDVPGESKNVCVSRQLMNFENLEIINGDQSHVRQKSNFPFGTSEFLISYDNNPVQNLSHECTINGSSKQFFPPITSFDKNCFNHEDMITLSHLVNHKLVPEYAGIVYVCQSDVLQRIHLGSTSNFIVCNPNSFNFGDLRGKNNSDVDYPNHFESYSIDTNQSIVEMHYDNTDSIKENANSDKNCFSGRLIGNSDNLETKNDLDICGKYEDHRWGHAEFKTHHGDYQSDTFPYCFPQHEISHNPQLDIPSSVLVMIKMKNIHSGYSDVAMADIKLGKNYIGDLPNHSAYFLRRDVLKSSLTINHAFKVVDLWRRKKKEIRLNNSDGLKANFFIRNINSDDLGFSEYLKRPIDSNELFILMKSFRQQEMAEITTQNSVSFRIAGVKFYEFLDNKKVKKKFNRLTTASLNDSGAFDLLTRFFSSRKSAMKMLIKKVNLLRQWIFEQNLFYFYATSIVFFFDEVKKQNADVRWLDFAHAIPYNRYRDLKGSPDLSQGEKYIESIEYNKKSIIEGLDNILKIMKKVLYTENKNVLFSVLNDKNES